MPRQDVPSILWFVGGLPQDISQRDADPRHDENALICKRGQNIMKDIGHHQDIDNYTDDYCPDVLRLIETKS